MSAFLLCSAGGGSACVGYHLICTMLYAWFDKDVDISYDAVQVNHNHEYRSSVQANFVNYPRLYRRMRNIRFFDSLYAVILACAWAGVSLLPAVGEFALSFMCFLCSLLPTSGPVRFCFVIVFLANLRFLFYSDVEDVFVWLSCLRVTIFVACFALDRFVCLPTETHFLCSLILMVSRGPKSLVGIALIPAVAPLTFSRDLLSVRPSHLLLSTVVFLTITQRNQHQ